ncbi:hypothetical protein BDL97_03G126600 [Sphagnum fallax]|nr:hypothetical protein BDL97_03G126600 [Sphagnum fallax]
MLVLLAKPFITMLHKIVAVCDLVLAVILRMIMQHFCYSGSCVDYSSVIDAERLWRCVITYSGFDSPDSLYELLLCQNLCNCGKLVLLSQLPPPARNNNRSFQSLKDHKVIVIFSRVCFFLLGSGSFPSGVAVLCCFIRNRFLSAWILRHCSSSLICFHSPLTVTDCCFKSFRLLGGREELRKCDEFRLNYPTVIEFNKTINLDHYITDKNNEGVQLLEDAKECCIMNKISLAHNSTL